MLLKNDDRLELWSQGKHKEAMLGQGLMIKTSDSFSPLEYDKQQIQFVKAEILIDFGFAVTDKGNIDILMNTLLILLELFC